MARTYRTVAFCAVFTACCLMPWGVGAQNAGDEIISANTPQVLHGVPGVAVIIEALKTADEEAGLHKEDLQTDVELALRQAGIRVFKPLSGESVRAEFPTLYVNLTLCHAREAHIVGFSVLTRYEHTVILPGMPARRVIDAALWNDGEAGVVGEQRVEDIRSIVKDEAARFANAYLEANPKK